MPTSGEQQRPDMTLSGKLAFGARTTGENSPQTEQRNLNKRGDMREAVSTLSTERFVGSGPFAQFHNDTARPSPAALNTLNDLTARAKDPATRDALERCFTNYMRGGL